jgi:hypothetical protein
MRDVIHVYQNTVSGEVLRFGGHIAKFMGDGILAYFGWPRAHEDAAERAVRAGLAAAGSVARLRIPTGDTLAARVGIATGVVIVGDLIGQGAAQEEVVVGDTLNLAARLQAAAEPGQVIVAAGTQRLLGDLFELEDLGPQTLNGIGESRRSRYAGSDRQPAAARRDEATCAPWSVASKSSRCWSIDGAWRRLVKARGCCWLERPGSANRGSPARGTQRGLLRAGRSDHVPLQSRRAQRTGWQGNSWTWRSRRRELTRGRAGPKTAWSWSRKPSVG